MKPTLIESSSQMDALLGQLGDTQLIAVDTEFFRETSYYPQLALVQIATDSVVACVDPLAFDAKPALKKLLLDDNITKIFHSCSQDLEVLYYYLGDIPKPVYDTQIANALLTEHHQIGYASLVENELGTLLDKSQTRTNWLQRPLTAKQIQYAGDDVLYLYQLQSIIDEKLISTKRQSWFNEESDKLVINENNFQVETKKLWRRVKGASRLNRNKLAVVQAIAEWRENIAQNKDKTRRRILKDDLVIKLALNPPKDTDILNQTIAYQCKVDNDDLQQLLDTIENAEQLPEDQWPDNRFNALDPEQKTLLKNLQRIVNTTAEDLSIASAIICSKKDLESLIIQHGNNPKILEPNYSSSLNIMQGWRLPCVGNALIEAMLNAENIT